MLSMYFVILPVKFRAIQIKTFSLNGKMCEKNGIFKINKTYYFVNTDVSFTLFDTNVGN